MKKLIAFGLFTLLLSVNVKAFTVPQNIRVGLSFDNPATNSVTIVAPSGVVITTQDGTQLHQSAGNTSITLRTNITGGINAEINDQVIATSPMELSLRPISGNLSFNNISYRGNIHASRINNGNLNIINVVDINDYVRGVVGREIGGGAPLEAMKAQAVAARTYAADAANRGGRHSEHNIHLCISVHCQVYGGIPAENANINRAVDETRNVIGTVGGRIISMVYFASTGGSTEFVEHGWTENAEFVWGFAHPHLVARPSPNETPPNWYHWTYEVTPAQLTSRLEHLGLGTITNIEILDQTPRGVTTRLRITGTNGERIFEREACRSFLGASALRSQAYSLEVVRNNQGTIENYIFRGRGWGHLVGMSQEGAMAMARNGANYETILKHYYTGLHLITIDGSVPTPAPSSNITVIDASGNRRRIEGNSLTTITANGIRQTIQLNRFWIRTASGVQEIVN
jgi:SpoIID/LytB domain protein